jgi:hypothetical protein
MIKTGFHMGGVVMGCKQLYKYYHNGKIYIFDLLFLNKKVRENSYSVDVTTNFLGYIS